MSPASEKGRGMDEKLISVPLLPEAKVKSVIISDEYPEIITALQNKCKIRCIHVIKNLFLNNAISKHADCCFLQLNKNNIFTDLSNYNNIVTNLTNAVGEDSGVLIHSPEKIYSPYPNDVSLNAKVIGNSIICNSKYISDAVKKTAVDLGFSFINVNQGYSACSTIVLNDNALITDDKSIYVSSERNGIECILVSKGSVALKGYDYGFIGGTCGMIDKNFLAFTGKLKYHSDADKIICFLAKHNIRFIELSEGPLIDIGGIIPLTETTDAI